MKERGGEREEKEKRGKEIYRRSINATQLLFNSAK